jgi:menaquinone-dependent protoporphyrinogen oxidase
MSEILIAFASTHGHTNKIAARIADVLRAGGHTVDVHGAVDVSDPAPRDYDAVIVGASIHGGQHQHEIVEWARRHGPALAMTPSAFFTVCLTAADDTAESRAATRGYLDDFEDLTGWLPRLRTTFAGALQYRAYSFATRLVIRLMMKRGNHPTDTSRDYDYTDWDAVEAFARECAELPARAAA